MLLASAIRAADADPVRSGWDPLDDRWYSDDMLVQSSSGVLLSAESIMRCGTVLAAVRFLADSYAMCPPSVGVKLAGGGRRMEPLHPAQRVLRKPNPWQTGFRFRHVNMFWASTWGNAYNRMIPGPTSFADELWPIHPSRIRPIDQRNDGTLVYEYTPPRGTGGQQRFGQEEILHYRGISFDGIAGAPIYQLIRNTVGIALAAEKHTATFLKKGTRLAGLLIPSAPMNDEARALLRRSWNEGFGGSDNTGTVGVMPFGLDFKVVGIDNQKGQLVELTDNTVGAILRFLGVPGVVVGWMGDKTATYASADAFYEKGGIRHCLMPWIMNFEQEEEFSLLIDDGEERFIKHSLDILMRANLKDRYAAYFQAAGRPWLTGNEVRETDDLDPIEDDPSMDKVALPTNTSAGGAPAVADPNAPPDDQVAPKPKPKPKPQPADDTNDNEARRRLEQFAMDASARIVRREIAAIKGPNGGGAAVRHARDAAGWRAWVASYYEKHVAVVVDLLHIDEAAAAAYCASQRAALEAGGAAVIETWEDTVIPRLAALALGE